MLSAIFVPFVKRMGQSLILVSMKFIPTFKFTAMPCSFTDTKAGGKAATSKPQAPEVVKRRTAKAIAKNPKATDVK